MNSSAERIFRADAETRGRYSPQSVGRAAQIVVRRLIRVGGQISIFDKEVYWEYDRPDSLGKES